MVIENILKKSWNFSVLLIMNQTLEVPIIPYPVISPWEAFGYVLVSKL